MRPRTRLLLAGAAAAATTANAVRPFGRGRMLAVPSFALGLAPSEFPVQTGLLQLGVGAVLVRGGGVQGWQGRLGIAAHVASAAGLAVVARRAGRAGDVLEAALVEGLGADYRSRIAHPFTPRPEPALTHRARLRPERRFRRRYRAARDIRYGDFGVRNELDVWKRRDLPADARAPVLFQVHGGAWTMGRKEGQAEPLMAHLAERGWVCVTANYRLSPRATWPDQIVDVKRALAWVKATIAEHGGDPDFVVITGGSAGGHLSALAAVTANVAEYQPGFEAADTTVAAAVPFYGVYDLVNAHGATNDGLERHLAGRVFKSRLSEDRRRWEQASPISHVGPEVPPFFVLHGTNDSLVPTAQAQTFVRALRDRSSQPVVYAELPGAQHAFEAMPSERTHATVHAVERFLAVVRTGHGGATPAQAVTAATGP